MISVNSEMMEAKFDLFTKVADRRDIVDFVREVEKYPCLYDTTLPEYANKMNNRSAWSEIAKRANTSVPDCRDKWRKIRISFMRSLKMQQSDKPPLRPYYLTEELHFLTPFIKIKPRTQCESIEKPAKDERMEFEVAAVEKHEKQEFSDTDSSDIFEQESQENGREINRFTINDNTIPNIMKAKTENGYGRDNGHIRQNAGRNSYSDDIEGNPRKMFLLSMLPDIESLTEPEMRIFRREVIMIVDNIINQRSIRN